MAATTLDELLVTELRDLYHAEKQLTKALPKMAKTASAPELRECFETHLEETRGQIERLEEIFEQLGTGTRGKRCEAMEGLLAEAREHMEEIDEATIRDVAMIGAAQKVEHYEIAGYGTAVALARQLGHEEVASRLEETLEEEKATDAKLNEVALSAVNAKASGMPADEDGDEHEDEDEMAGATAEVSSEGRSTGSRRSPSRKGN
jgi:ferritin-like metal-binding protein YciE